MPDNAFFYYVAYAAAGFLYVAYGISLVSRWRSVRRRSAETKL